MKCLFIVSGFGLGNSNRDGLIIKALKKIFNQDLEIDVLTSANGIIFFKKFEERVTIHQQIETNYNLSDRAFVFKFICLLLQLPKVIINSFLQLKLIMSNKYDVVFVDSDYSLLMWKFLTKTKVIAINNSYVIIKKYKNKINFQYLCEKFELFYYTRLADIVICPCLKHYEESNIQSKIKTINFVQQVPSAHKIKIKPKVLTVILGGSKYSELDKLISVQTAQTLNLKINILGKYQDSTEDIMYLGRVWGAEKNKIIIESDIILINGGFSSICEALTYNIPTLCLPLANHVEQLVNASVVQSNNFVVTSAKHFENDLKMLVEKYSEFNNFDQKINRAEQKFVNKIYEVMIAINLI